MNTFLEIPSTPTNTKVTFVNQSAVKLAWQLPEITGIQTDVYYDVECRKTCNEDDVMNCDETACRRQVNYLPSKQGLNETHVVITHVSSFVTYEFRIYARNRVSEVAQKMHGIEASFILLRVTTNASSEFVCFPLPLFRQMDVLNNIIIVHWNATRSLLTQACYIVPSSTLTILLSSCAKCQSCKLLSILIGKKITKMLVNVDFIL